MWLWCHHLAQIHPDIQLNKGTLTVYRNMHGMPEAWVDSMVHAQNQSEADELLSSMQQTRAGPMSDHLATTLEQEHAMQVNVIRLNHTVAQTSVQCCRNSSAILQCIATLQAMMDTTMEQSSEAQLDSPAAAALGLHMPGSSTAPKCSSPAPAAMLTLANELNSTAASQSTARHLAAAFGNVSTISTSPQATCAIADGMDEHELQVTDTTSSHHVLRTALEHNPQNVVHALRHGSALVSSIARTQKPASDYDPTWFLLTHPWSFPQGTGGKPAGVGLEAWMRIILQRYSREQHAQNPHLVMDMFDVLQRHQTSTQAYVQMKVDSATVARIGMLDNESLNTAIDVLKQYLQGIWFWCVLYAAGTLMTTFGLLHTYRQMQSIEI